ncbi:MAG: TolC family protein [Deltaproteobacteria bacterium]|nr:TolC family protein [Deltaproteobacteria bacterium]MBI4796710.1 TolC family protein [Deltaproteobacteria bacterium]
MTSRTLRHLFLVWLLTWNLAVVPGGAAEAPATLDLREALRLAWKANPTLQVSRLEDIIAGEEVVRARSGFLPQVRAEVSQTIFDDPTKIKLKGVGPGGGTDSFPMTNRNYWSSKVSVDQTIFDFWATPSRYQAAVLGKAATRLDTAQTRDNIFLTVCQGYFRVLRAEKMVTVAQQEVTQLKDHLKIARDQFEFGVVTFNDVLQAEVALADAQQRLITANNDVTNLQSNLNKVLGLPIAAPTALKEEKELSEPTGELNQATDQALKRRSDLQASQNRIQQGEKVITQTRAGHFPRFFAQAGHTYQKNDIWVHDSQYFAIFGMQWNLFSGLDTHAQVAQARERLTQLRVRHQDLSDQVRLDVQTAYLGLKETRDRIRVTEKAVAQGEENLRLNGERYKEQVGTATDVIDAQTLLTRTRVNYFNALYDHQMAKAQMLWAVGAINDLLPQEKPRHAP